MEITGAGRRAIGLEMTLGRSFIVGFGFMLGVGVAALVPGLVVLLIAAAAAGGG